MNINVTIRFGAANSIDKAVPAGTTVSGLLRDANIQGVLGFGNNVQAVIDGVVQRDTSPVNDGDVITVETKANTKASK